MPLASLSITESLKRCQGVADCAKCDWKNTVIAIGEHFIDVGNDFGFALQ
jgi:hypothetical protein